VTRADSSMTHTLARPWQAVALLAGSPWSYRRQSPPAALVSNDAKGVAGQITGILDLVTWVGHR
jgi:hypothetical protein